LYFLMLSIEDILTFNNSFNPLIGYKPY
jgi:hypothetical protein